MQIPIQQFDFAPSGSWRSAAFSIVTHALVLLLLFLWLRHSQPASSVERSRTGQIVLTQIKSDAATEYLAKTDVAKSQANSPSTSSAVNNSPPKLPNLETPKLDMAGAASIEPSVDVNSMAAERTSGARFEYKFSESDLEAIESDRKHFKSIKAQGPATTISIFGSGELTGRKFVFLIDRSKSMGEQGLRVLRNATSELVNGINRLEKNHYFQIVAYNDHVTSLQQRTLLPATPANKKLVPPFMTNLLAYGGTNHIGAFYSALAFDPDVILVLNDGGFPELNAGQIAELGRLCSGTEIHALHFGLGPPQTRNHFMQQLAETCSGSYRYIDVREWQNKQAGDGP